VSYALDPVPSASVPRLWPVAARWVSVYNAKYPPRWRFTNAYEKCCDGHAQLWLVRSADSVVGIVITQITTDAERVAEVPVVAGIDLEAWLHLLDELEAWARREGCVAMVSTAAREGWVRVLKNRGWRKTAVLMERML
jgi:hypothetical protein